VKLKKLAQLVALMGVVGPVMAQEAAAPAMQRVEVTGSSIKRVAKEGALPVQVISFEQMEKQGITTAEQLVRTLSANGTGAENMTSGNNVFGADADRLAGGASFASLRGLGPGATLVLLNGRRVATHGASGRAVDLNSIPLGAISRVEILKDGASAIYGTDAIGGVINFILKTNYSGVEASVSTNDTQAGGGATRRASILAGTGSLEEDGYNLMASLTVDKAQRLNGSDRSFVNGYQPGRGLSPDTTGTPFANQTSGPGTTLQIPDPNNPGKFIGGYTLPGDPTVYLQANPLSFQGKCDTIPGMSQYQTPLWKDVTSPRSTTHSCAYDYGTDYVLQFPVERVNFLSRGTFKLAPDHRMFVEVLGSRTKATAILTPLQVQTSIANKAVYPVGGAYYQDLSAYIPSFDKTKPIAYKWRANEIGNRTQENTTDNARVLLGFEGNFGKWDYKTGVSYAQSTTKTKLTDGYSYTDKLYAALGTGIINPWVGAGQSQTEAARQLIESTKFRGAFQHGKTTLTQIDGSVSGELFQLPAGAVAMAAGFDLRREGYSFAQDVDANMILLAPGNAALKDVSRNVKAVYAELLVPIMKDLEMQLAVRRDDYSQVGATTNPKIALRYQPADFILFRASASKGFLAPSFDQLYSGVLTQELPNGVKDPEGCAKHPGVTEYCSPRLIYTTGGNLNLKPETSKQGSVGIVIEPVKGYSASFDYWAINTQDQLLKRTPQVVLANYQALNQYIFRKADGTIDYVQAGWFNAGGSRVRGLDVSLRGEGKVKEVKWTATLDGTYMDSFKFAEYKGQEYKELVGNFYTRDLYLRWKHNASFSVSRGDWSGLLVQSFASGYKDQVPNDGKGTPPPGFKSDVSSYTTYNLSGTYTGFKNTTLTLGIQNLFDRDPPFTAHNVDEVVGAGWDPRVADPRGRAFTFQLKYKFM
jgi:iron complex outermembrane receptor protein